MTTALLTAVDGLALASSALAADAGVLAWVDNDPGRITGDVLAPFPRYRIETSGVTYDLHTYISTHDLRVSSYAEKVNNPGDVVLQQMLGAALVPLMALEYRQYGPGEPVVTNVLQYLPMQPLPEPGGRLRWQVGIRLYMHPSAVSLAP